MMRDFFKTFESSVSRDMVLLISDVRFVSAHTKRFFESATVDNQDYEEIRRDCFERRKLFKDWVFRAADKSLAWEDAIANVTFKGYRLNQERVQWLRPQVIKLFMDS